MTMSEKILTLRNKLNRVFLNISRASNLHWNMTRMVMGFLLALTFFLLLSAFVATFPAFASTPGPQPPPIIPTNGTDGSG